MRYSSNRTDLSLAHQPALTRRLPRSSVARPGLCDAQLSLALEPGAERPAYVVQVKGDRMQEAGIRHGDLVAIQKSGQGRGACVTVTRLDQSVREWIHRGEGLPAVTLWGKPVTLAASADIEGVFVGVLRQGKTLH